MLLKGNLRMNLKKYLQQQTEKDAESLLTEADRIFCLELAQKAVEQQREEKPRRKWWKLKRKGNK